MIGTKFSQQTSVCHHQASIICKKKTEETEESSASEESLRNDVSMKVRLNIMVMEVIECLGPVPVVTSDISV